jgi:hypothetical protein
MVPLRLVDGMSLLSSQIPLKLIINQDSDARENTDF